VTPPIDRCRGGLAPAPCRVGTVVARRATRSGPGALSGRPPPRVRSPAALPSVLASRRVAWGRTLGFDGLAPGSLLAPGPCRDEPVLAPLHRWCHRSRRVPGVGCRWSRLEPAARRVAGRPGEPAASRRHSPPSRGGRTRPRLVLWSSSCRDWEVSVCPGSGAWPHGSKSATIPVAGAPFWRLAPRLGAAAPSDKPQFPADLNERSYFGRPMWVWGGKHEKTRWDAC